MMYIPPEGALQFHVRESSFENIGDIAVWVVPFTSTIQPRLDRRANKCSCQLYTILIDSLPDRIRKAYIVLESRFGPTEIIVCSCVGEVIE